MKNPLSRSQYLQIKEQVQECESCTRLMQAYEDEFGMWTFWCFCGDHDGPYSANAPPGGIVSRQGGEMKMTTPVQNPESTLARLAEEASVTVVERTYTEGCSRDIQRPASTKESRIIADILFGGLLALRFGADPQSVADTCEFIAGRILGDGINCYLSVYLPLQKLAVGE